MVGVWQTRAVFCWGDGGDGWFAGCGGARYALSGGSEYIVPAAPAHPLANSPVAGGESDDGSRSPVAGGADTEGEEFDELGLDEYDLLDLDRPIEGQKVYRRAKYLYGNVTYQPRLLVKCPVHQHCLKTRGIYQDEPLFGPTGTRFFLGCCLHRQDLPRAAHRKYQPTPEDMTAYAIDKGLVYAYWEFASYVLGDQGLMRRNILISLFLILCL